MRSAGQSEKRQMYVGIVNEGSKTEYDEMID